MQELHKKKGEVIARLEKLRDIDDIVQMHLRTLGDIKSELTDKV